MKLLLGDCLDKLKELDDNSIDSIVTDPPYGLSFMGKKWDYDVPSQDVWEQCMRVLKPGGYLLAFAGSRTYHRMAVRIEDAGFEIRDQIMWVYGSGFPKSLNLGIQVDKKLGNEREVVGEKVRGDVEKAKQNGAGYLADPANRNNTKQFGYGTEIITKGNTEWEGWGTALKPAHEPIVMARKPLSEKTVVDNVLEWGTGGINIDDSRISTDDNLGGGATKGSVLDIEGFDRPWMHDEEKMKEFGDKMKEKVKHAETLGRFPANVIFDEEAGKILDEQSGERKGFSGGGGPTRFGGATGGKKLETYNYHNDTGGASRFFYCPKTSKTDRNEGLEEFEDVVIDSNDFKNLPAIRNNSINTSSGKLRNVLPTKNHHPTVKPTDLMLYLIRLVTPKGGTTLDPFMGSGSTGKAAVRGGFDFVGIEKEKEYFEIAEARIQYEIDRPKTVGKKQVTINKDVVGKLNEFFG